LDYTTDKSGIITSPDEFYGDAHHETYPLEYHEIHHCTVNEDITVEKAKVWYGYTTHPDSPDSYYVNNLKIPAGLGGYASESEIDGFVLELEFDPRYIGANGEEKRIASELYKEIDKNSNQKVKISDHGKRWPYPHVTIYFTEKQIFEWEYNKNVTFYNSEGKTH
jgi:hypothetical protein